MLNLSELIARVRSLTESSAVEEAGPDPNPPAETLPERTPTVQHDGAAALVDLFDSSEREHLRLALGRLVAMPAIPEDVAAELLPLLLDLTEEPTRTRDGVSTPNKGDASAKRAGYRGLEAICEHYPHLVLPHAGEIAKGVTDFHVVARDAAWTTMVTLIETDPAAASALYPLLDDPRADWSGAAFSVLVEAADTHPVVLAPVVPYLTSQMAQPSVDRAMLVRAIDRLSRYDPEIIDATGSYLLQWTQENPAVGNDEAAIRVLQRYDPNENEAGELATVLLDLGADPETAADAGMFERLDDLAQGNRNAKEHMRRWGNAASALEGQRLRARLDEHADIEDNQLRAAVWGTSEGAEAESH